MPATSLSSLTLTGDKPALTQGRVPAVLEVALTPTAAASTDFSFTLPPNSKLVSVREVTDTAFTGTTVTVQLGSTAGGVDYVAAADIKAAAVRDLTLLSPAMAALASPGTVFGRIAQTGATAVGAGRLLVTYLPPLS